MSLDYEFANRIIEHYNFPKTTKFDLHFVQEKIKDNSKLEKKYTKIVNKYIIDESINNKKARKN